MPVAQHSNIGAQGGSGLRRQHRCSRRAGICGDLNATYMGKKRCAGAHQRPGMARRHAHKISAGQAAARRQASIARRFAAAHSGINAVRSGVSLRRQSGAFARTAKPSYS